MEQRIKQTKINIRKPNNHKELKQTKGTQTDDGMELPTLKQQGISDILSENPKLGRLGSSISRRVQVHHQNRAKHKAIENSNS